MPRTAPPYTTPHHATNRACMLHTSIHTPIFMQALHCIALHDTQLHNITWHYITLHNIINYITLHNITLHYITLHCIALHCITLHYITLYIIILHCIATVYCIHTKITNHHLSSASVSESWPHLWKKPIASVTCDSSTISKLVFLEGTASSFDRLSRPDSAHWSFRCAHGSHSASLGSRSAGCQGCESNHALGRGQQSGAS